MVGKISFNQQSYLGILEGNIFVNIIETTEENYSCKFVAFITFQKSSALRFKVLVKKAHTKSMDL